MTKCNAFFDSREAMLPEGRQMNKKVDESGWRNAREDTGERERDENSVRVRQRIVEAREKVES